MKLRSDGRTDGSIEKKEIERNPRNRKSEIARTRLVERKVNAYTSYGSSGSEVRITLNETFPPAPLAAAVAGITRACTEKIP